MLRCAKGLDNIAVAAELGVNQATVRKWRERFLRDRLDGLTDAPRPGQPRKISDDDVEAVVVKTLTTTPKHATHWSSRDMAKESGLNQTAITRIWKAFGLQPWRTDDFTLSNDPLFIEKVRDVVGLHLDPPEHAVVLCVDEKTQCQALDRAQPVLPMRPTTPERRTHDHLRHGVTSLFAALNVATGNVITQTRRRHRSSEFKKFLIDIDKAVPSDLDVHLVMDNVSTHKTPEIKKWLLRHPRFHVHFTPTYSSWLNLVERWFAEITQRLLRRGVHRSVQALEADIRSWVALWNEDPKPFVWKKTADEILDSLAGYLSRINDSGH